MKMMSDKRGFVVIPIITGIILLIGVVVAFIVLLTYAKDLIDDGIAKGATGIGDYLQDEVGSSTKGILNVLTYIFGPVPNYLEGVSESKISSVIVIIAMWVLLFVTFSDIFANFSTFSTEISWIIGAVIAIIAANLKAVFYFTIVFTSIFTTLGLIGIFLGLGAAIVAFVAVNAGITSLGPWIMHRKAMQEAAKAQAGGEELSGKLKGLIEAGEALKHKPRAT